MTVASILIRADASLDIGTGHVMRCLTLAEALRERGASCRFVCRAHPGNLIDLIRQRGFAVHALPHDPNWKAGELAPPHAAWLGADWRTDAEQTKVGAGDTAADWLIVDHYALDARWERQLRPVCRKLMVIDDLADRTHDCDLLLDQNLLANLDHRYDERVPSSCGKMLGPEYALLQPQYAVLHRHTPPRQGTIQRVLISFGGADVENHTGMAITAFLASTRENVTLDVVINPSAPHASTIRQQVKGHTQISLHEGLPTLAPLMAKADLAIGACGITTWERCCLGLPCLVVTLAENQKPIAAELDRRGLIRWLGHASAVDSAMLDQALTEILGSGLTASWSEHCWRHVDGLGADRVSAIMALDVMTPLAARPARLEDEDRILRWANDLQVRRNSFNPGLIPSATHHAWFQKRLQMPGHCRLFIVESLEGYPVGQVRFERSDGEWELHYGIDACYRRRGIAANFLATALHAFGKEFPDARVFGRVKPENEASCRVFRKLGFVETQGESETAFHLTIG